MRRRRLKLTGRKERPMKQSGARIRVWDRVEQSMVDVIVGDPALREDLAQAAQYVHETSAAISAALVPGSQPASVVDDDA
jgi:hypothetical protein